MYQKQKLQRKRTLYTIMQSEVKNLILTNIYDKNSTNKENFECQLSIINIHFRLSRRKVFVIN